MIDINTKKIDQITDSRFDENYPVFSNTDDVLFYTADSSGTWNLFRYDLVNKKSTVITNLLTGIFQLSLNKYDDTMVFSGYSSRGWDVYRMNNPLDLEKVDIQPTNYYKNKDIDKFIANRAKRGRSLPRGYQQVSSIDFEIKASTSSEKDAAK